MSTTTTTTTTTPKTMTASLLPTQTPIVISRKENLVLRRMLPRDIPAYTRITDTCFAKSMTKLFYPLGQTEASKAYRHRSLHNALTRDSHYLTTLVTVDTSSQPCPDDLSSLSTEDRIAAQSEGRVVGHSAWKIHPTPRTEADLLAASAISDTDGSPPDADSEMLSLWTRAVQDGKRVHIDSGKEAHVLLHLIATDPDWKGRGVAGLHLRWGMGETDKLGVIGYLEASDEGKEIYRRLGFEEVGKMDFDMARWGAEGGELTFMVRPAKVKILG